MINDQSNHSGRGIATDLHYCAELLIWKATTLIRRPLRQALEMNADSVTLWKAAINLEDKTMPRYGTVCFCVFVCVECNLFINIWSLLTEPYCIQHFLYVSIYLEMWLALARLET